jgi:hypothetical protein
VANSDNDRFYNIQKAQKDNLIPEKAVLYFAEFFSTNTEGKQVILHLKIHPLRLALFVNTTFYAQTK